MMTFEDMSCNTDPTFDAPQRAGEDSLSQQLTNFFENLPSVYDESCANKSVMNFSLTTSAGRDNVAKLCAHTLQIARCGAEEQSSNEFKEIVYETIDFLVKASIAWLLLTHVMQRYEIKLDVFFDKKMFATLDALLTVFVGIILFVRFNTCTLMLELMTFRNLMMYSLIALALLAIYVMVMSDDIKRKLIILLCTAIALVVLYYTFRAKSNTNLRHLCNHMIEGANEKLHTNFAQIRRWRASIPSFTDAFFISVGSALLAFEGMNRISRL
jgi:hypothetical protein